MSITDELLKQFKDRMHLGDHEDDNIKGILSASVVDLREKCGNYDIYSDERFKELVFERARYVYNDALEFFNDNFISQINSLLISNALSEIVLEDDADASV